MRGAFRFGWLLLIAISLPAVAAPSGADPPRAPLERWQFFCEIGLPVGSGGGPYCDAIVPTAVFDKARLDLGDLRIIDAAGTEVPYALRVRRPDYRDETFPAREFNRSTGADKSTELQLDLEGNLQPHNQVDVETPGMDFRRRAELDGSDDGKQWRRLVGAMLLRFATSDAKLDQHRVAYPPSRFRYLRLRVYPDPAVDKEPVEIVAASVHRKVEVAGEMVTLPAKIGPRQPVQTAEGSGSAWVLDLGGDRVPCERIVAEVADESFARPYVVEVEGRPDWSRETDVALSADAANQAGAVVHVAGHAQDYRGQPPQEAEPKFTQVASGLWQRLPGEKHKPLVAVFAEEARASRLRLKVTDNRNPPLDLQNVNFVAPARELVFANAAQLRGPLRLYFGNPAATAPHYDLERNLPDKLDSAPTRLRIGERQANPDYVAEPKPLTERWPWLIYAVLSAASVVLAAILLNLARAAVARHDAGHPNS